MNTQFRSLTKPCWWPSRHLIWCRDSEQLFVLGSAYCVGTSKVKWNRPGMSRYGTRGDQIPDSRFPQRNDRTSGGRRAGGPEPSVVCVLGLGRLRRLLCAAVHSTTRPLACSLSKDLAKREPDFRCGRGTVDCPTEHARFARQRRYRSRVFASHKGTH